MQDSLVRDAGGQEFLQILARHPVLMAKVLGADTGQMIDGFLDWSWTISPTVVDGSGR